MTRKKKSEMAPLSPPNNVKRALLLALVAVLHFGRCDSLTVVGNEGKREGMSNRNCAMGRMGVSFVGRTNRIRQIGRMFRHDQPGLSQQDI